MRSDPETGKALRDELAGMWTLRFGRLRLVYRLAGKAMEILLIGPRATIYEEVARVLERERTSRDTSPGDVGEGPGDYPRRR